MVMQWLAAAGFIVLALLATGFAIRKPSPTSLFALIASLSIAIISVAGAIRPSNLEDPRPEWLYSGYSSSF